MDLINCKVTYRKPELQACFFYKTFFSTLDLKRFKFTFISAGVFLVLYLLSLTICKSTNDYWLTFIFLFFPFVACLFSFLKYLILTFKWKKRVDEYIQNLLTYKTVTLTVNEKGCGIQFDEENSFRFWEFIVMYVVRTDHIKIIDKKDDYILIPKNSVDETTFEYLKDILKNKGDLPEGHKE